MRTAWQGPLVVLVVAGCVIGLATYLESPRSTRIKAGQAAPDLDLPILGEEGKRLGVYKLRGLPLLVVFVDTHASSAEAQLSQIEEVNRQYSARGLRTLGVAVDADPSAAETFLSRLPLSFAIVADKGGVAVKAAYGTTSFPEAYLVESSGRVNAVFPGLVAWRSPQVRDSLEDVLPRQAPRPLRSPS